MHCTYTFTTVPVFRSSSRPSVSVNIEEKTSEFLYWCKQFIYNFQFQVNIDFLALPPGRIKLALLIVNKISVKPTVLEKKMRKQYLFGSKNHSHTHWYWYRNQWCGKYKLKTGDHATPLVTSLGEGGLRKVFEERPWETGVNNNPIF